MGFFVIIIIIISIIVTVAVVVDVNQCITIRSSWKTFFSFIPIQVKH